MSQATEREEYYCDFERDGEAETRRQVEVGELSGEALSFARDWLGRFDAQREEERRAESSSLARRATLAAEAAVAEARVANAEASRARRAAQNANRIAIAALAITIIAIIKDMIGLSS